MSVDMDLIAQHVHAGVCPHCGSQRTTWTPTEIVEALHLWRETKGIPPRRRDWLRATPEWPAMVTVDRLFGSLNNALQAAGIPTSRSGAQTYWTKELILNALLDWLLAHGSWPSPADWARKQRGVYKYPHTHTVVAAFGSWTAAKTAAGWTGPMRWRKSEIVMALRAYASKHDGPPTATLLRSADRPRDLPSEFTIKRRFGTLTAALEAAGLPTYSDRRSAARYGAGEVVEPADEGSDSVEIHTVRPVVFHTEKAA